MNISDDGPVTLNRGCDAIHIPYGTPITLDKGSIVFIVQDLGGNYTVNYNGNLAQIGARDADALGFEIIKKEISIEEATLEDGTLNEEVIWAELCTCYDPEIPHNIVDLGLVYDCRVSKLAEGGNRVDIVMTLTTPGCGMSEFLAADARSKITAIPGVEEVNIELTFDPPWSQDMMSEAIRLELGMF